MRLCMGVRCVLCKSGYGFGGHTRKYTYSIMYSVLFDVPVQCARSTMAHVLRIYVRARQTILYVFY